MTERCIFVGNIGSCTALSIADFFRACNVILTKIDIKAGYAFGYCEDSPGLENAMHELSQIPFSKERRLLKIEFSKGQGRKDEEIRRKRSVPTDTLFIVGFDPTQTYDRDMRDFLSKYGRIVRVDMKKNFAFVQFTSIEDATAALNAENGQLFMGRTISVQFVEDRNARLKPRDRELGIHDLQAVRHRPDEWGGNRGAYGAPDHGPGHYGPIGEQEPLNRWSGNGTDSWGYEGGNDPVDRYRNRRR
mmetsp:Transcript_10592/g.10663  ORF Transcript_10592/g.10663 Transcript_10592/m.10663 type:complete len:246 (-) Transcript_10592:969-1706(-)